MSKPSVGLVATGMVSWEGEKLHVAPKPPNDKQVNEPSYQGQSTRAGSGGTSVRSGYTNGKGQGQGHGHNQNLYMGVGVSGQAGVKVRGNLYEWMQHLEGESSLLAID